MQLSKKLKQTKNAENLTKRKLFRNLGKLIRILTIMALFNANFVSTIHGQGLNGLGRLSDWLSDYQ